MLIAYHFKNIIKLTYLKITIYIYLSLSNNYNQNKPQNFLHLDWKWIATQAKNFLNIKCAPRVRWMSAMTKTTYQQLWQQHYASRFS